MTETLTPTNLPKTRLRVDGTWAMPSRTEPFDEYLAGTAHRVNTNHIKAFSPDDRARKCATIFGEAGIVGDQPLAVYDRVGMVSSPWIWWLLRSHGCDVALIEGWGQTEIAPPDAAPVQFMSQGNPTAFNATKDDIRAAMDSHVQIVDARPAERFRGEVAEPRPECRSGHIPGSLNVPFVSLKSGRTFLDNDDLMRIFDEAEVDLSLPTITSCGSGVTASGLAYALTRCGAEDVRVYQGSWAEWGADPNLPIEVGS